MKIELNHSLTPQALADVNRAIMQCLTEVESPERYQTFLALVRQRDDIITSYLESSDPESARSFAEQEVSVNNILKELAQSLLNSAKDDVSQFVKSQKAVKKYRK